MASVSLRSLVEDITGTPPNNATFEAHYKKVRRMHDLFCEITGKSNSKDIDSSTVSEYKSLMKVLFIKFTTTDEGSQIERIMKKAQKNNQPILLGHELDDILLSWFEEAYEQVVPESNDLGLIARYQSILVQKENEELADEIQQIVQNDLANILKVANDIVLNELLAAYKEMLITPTILEQRHLVHCILKLQKSN